MKRVGGARAAAAEASVGGAKRGSEKIDDLETTGEAAAVVAAEAIKSNARANALKER